MVSDVFIQVITDLKDMGILDVVLPFLLFFTIMFAVLQKTMVLGKDEDGKPRKNYNVVIALVIGMMIIVPHTVFNADSTDTQLPNGWPDPVVVVNTSLPQIAVIAVAIVMVMMLLGLVGGDQEIKKDYTVWAAVIAGLIVAGIFIASMFNSVPSWLSGFFDSGTMAIVVMLLIFGLIIYLITKED